MRKWIIVGVVLVCLTAGSIFVLLNLNALIARNKDSILAKVEEATGRTVSVGAVNVTLFSGIGVKLADLAIADDPEFSSAPFFRASELQINLRFWPLLARELRIKRVIVRDPKIEILRNREGFYNFSSIGARKSGDAPDTRKQSDQEASQRGDIAAAVFSLVNVTGGEIHYADRKLSADIRMTQVAVKVDDFDAEGPFNLAISAAIFGGEPNLNVRASIGPLGNSRSLLNVPVDGNLECDPVHVSRLFEALPALQSALPESLQLGGVFGLEQLRFKGALSAIAVAGNISATEGRINYNQRFQKAPGMPLLVQFDGTYENGRLALRSGRVRLHSADIAVAGDFGMAPDAPVNMALAAKPFSLDGWESVFPALAGTRLQGSMDADLTLSGKALTNAVPDIKGILRLHNASVRPPGFPKDIRDLDTEIKFAGKGAEVRRMHLSLGQSRLDVTAAIKRFVPLTLSYSLSVPELFPADYKESLPAERGQDVLRNLRSQADVMLDGGKVTYRGAVQSERGTLFGLTYKDLDTRLSLAESLARIQELRVELLSGAVRLSGEYSFASPTPAFDMAAQMRGIDVKQLYEYLDPEAEQDLGGRLQGKMRLAGEGRTWAGIKKSLHGAGKAEIVDGILRNMNIAESALEGATGIPGMRHIFSPEVRKEVPETFAAKDTKFKELSAEFVLAKGRVDVKGLQIAAAEFLLQGSGWADFNRRVDFDSTVSFSRALSADLAESAREVRYLLNPEGRLAIPVSLKGRLPEARPRPDLTALGQMVQRNFLRRGAEDLQRSFSGGRDSQRGNAESRTGKQKKSSTEELIRRGLENLLRR